MPPISFLFLNKANKSVQMLEDSGTHGCFVYGFNKKTCFSFKIFHEWGGNQGAEEEQKLAALGNKEK